MRERYLQAGPRGLRLCLCEWGGDSGPLALILHGFADQGAAWAGVAERLVERGWRVIAPDQRGFGRSDHVGPGGYYHFPDYVRDLDALVHSLGETGFTLVGHSMGATVSSLYAGLRPEVPGRLVLIDGLGVPHSDPADAYGRFVAHLDHMRSPPDHRPLSDLEAGATRLRRFTPGLSPELALRLAERVAEPDGDGLRWRMDPLHRTRAPVGFDLERYLYTLSKITAPTTLAWASQGPFQTADVEDRKARIRDLTVVEVDGGHNLHIDNPGGVAAVIGG